MKDDAIPLIVENPVPNWLRTFFLAAGLFVIGIATWELARGVWPLNIFSPFFLFLILGAFSVGVPIATAGLLGWAESWAILPGEIHIRRRNPFAARNIRLARETMLDIAVVEIETMEGPNMWAVQLVPRTGERFLSRQFGSRTAAERLRGEILDVLEQD